MPPLLADHPFLAIAAIWLVASAIFIGVPVALSLGAIYRQAKRLGVARPAAVIRRRFLLRSASGAPLDTLEGREVWIECSRLGCTIRTPGRVAAAADRTLHIERKDATEMTFVAERQSASFAAGAGAATGLLRHDGSEGPGLVVVV